MKPLLHSSAVYFEIGHTSLKALSGESGVEMPMERLPNGRLTEACKEKIISGLRVFLDRKDWQPRARAYCAIGARGVSLRKLSLPSTGKEELQRLLRMQIENEFPLPPDELAWGWRVLGQTRGNGAAKQEILVIAVKKEVIDEYAQLFSRCGLNPVFTVAALARGGICPRVAMTSALLDVGRSQSELALFDGDVPSAVRVLPWGDETIKSGAVSADSALKSLNGNLSGRKLFISGGELPLAIRERFGPDCELLNVPAGEGRSAALLGLKKSVEDDAVSLVMFQTEHAGARTSLAHPAPLKLAAYAVALALALLLLPFAQAILLKPYVAKKVAAIEAQTNRLETIGRELDFLQALKQNQPPYLDALYLFSKCAPQGSRIDSLTMNRRGEVSFRGSMRTSDQVSEFRSKLYDSGFFSGIAVEEQSPTPDRQKLNIRLTAVWKPVADRMKLAIGPTAKEIEEAKSRKEPAPGAMPAGMPMGLPGGIVIGGMPAGAMPMGVRSSVRTIPGRVSGSMPAGLPPGITLPPGVQMPASFGSGATNGAAMPVERRMNP